MLLAAVRNIRYYCWYRRFWALVLASFVTFPLPDRSSMVWATPLLGDAGVAGNRLENVEVNPANLSKLEGSQISFFYSPISSNSFTFKIPGHPAVRKNKSHYGLNLEAVQFASRQNSPIKYSGVSDSGLLGLQVFALPPMNLSPYVAGFKIDEIPIVAFNQIQTLDAEIDRLYLRGAVSVAAAYSVSKRLALGFGLDYFAADIGTTLRLTETGAKFLTADLTAERTAATVGVRYNIVPHHFGIGLSTPVYAQTKAKMNVASGLLEQEVANGNQTQPFDSFNVGFRLGYQRIVVVSDVEYVKGKPEQGISLDEFTVKDREVYDTWTPHLGMTYKKSHNTRLLVGGKYRPARYGDGDAGQSGQAGFGGIDLTLVSLGVEQLTPYRQIGGGFEWDVKKEKRVQSGRNRQARPSYRYTLTYGVGFVYREASRGVDEQGDFPGAYTQKHLAVPMNVIYRY